MSDKNICFILHVVTFFSSPAHSEGICEWYIQYLITDLPGREESESAPVNYVQPHRHRDRLSTTGTVIQKREFRSENIQVQAAKNVPFGQSVMYLEYNWMNTRRINIFNAWQCWFTHFVGFADVKLFLFRHL